MIITTDERHGSRPARVTENRVYISNLCNPLLHFLAVVFPSNSAVVPQFRPPHLQQTARGCEYSPVTQVLIGQTTRRPIPRDRGDYCSLFRLKLSSTSSVSLYNTVVPQAPEASVHLCCQCQMYNPTRGAVVFHSKCTH
jgi:hypothetical protein